MTEIDLTPANDSATCLPLLDDGLCLQLRLWVALLEHHRKDGDRESNTVSECFLKMAEIIKSDNKTISTFIEGYEESESELLTINETLMEIKGILSHAIDAQAAMIAQIKAQSAFQKTLTEPLKQMAARIENISHETRMVSLNASIEAARDNSPQGATFDVIAKRIREFAVETSDICQSIYDQVAVLEDKMNGESIDSISFEKERKLLVQTTDVSDMLCTRIQSIRDDVSKFTSLLTASGKAIQSNVNQGLISLQYQDRVSQVLDHVVQHMQAVSHCINDAPVSPAERLTLLEQSLKDMYQRYSVDSERSIHLEISPETVPQNQAAGDSASQAEEDDVVFF